MTIDVHYDVDADAAFLEIATGISAATIIVSDRINVDLDAQGRLLCIEVLEVSVTAPSLVAGSVQSIAAE